MGSYKKHVIIKMEKNKKILFCGIRDQTKDLGTATKLHPLLFCLFVS